MIPVEYLNLKKELIEQYNYKAIREFLSSESYTEISWIQKIIFEDMENGFEDKPVAPVSENDIECIKTNLIRIKDLYNINPINNIINAYITNLLLIIKNWNDNTLKNNSIDDLVITISNFIDMNLTFRELLDANKVVLKEMQRLKNFKPIAYETARHYQESIDKAIADRGNNE
jgi:hypothetical protein